MIPINIMFWCFVLVFGLMGALRGWAKEILVSCSVVVALFLRLVLSKYVPFVREYLNGRPPLDQFYIYSLLIIFMAIVGYAGPTVSARLAGRAARENLQDALLGFIIGALNGYLIVGTMWYFLHQANYALWGMQAPGAGSPAEVIATKYLILAWMSDPLLMIIVALSFVFVLIAFL
jgi:uncharacterized membrane protein required for colicin V production